MTTIVNLTTRSLRSLVSETSGWLNGFLLELGLERSIIQTSISQNFRFYREI